MIQTHKCCTSKSKEGTTLTNPVYIPGGSGISGNDGSVAFEMVNIECWYGSISLRYCHGGRAIDCAAKYAFGGGAWSWGGGNWCGN